MKTVFKEFSGLASEIRTSLSVSAPVSGVTGGSVRCEAIWDTGANTSAVSLAVAKKLGLVAANKAFVNTASGRVETPVFMVDLSLPNGQTIRDVLVTGLDIKVCDALIGMDIITRGDFVISNAPNTRFEFRVPSEGLPILT